MTSSWRGARRHARLGRQWGGGGGGAAQRIQRGARGDLPQEREHGRAAELPLCRLEPAGSYLIDFTSEAGGGSTPTGSLHC